MNFYVNWRTAVKAIFKNRKRSALTMFGIIIGIASVIAILSIGRGFERETIKSLTNEDSEEIKIEVNFLPNDDSIYQSNLSLFNDPDLSIAKEVSGVEEAGYSEADPSSIYKNIVIDGKNQTKELSLVTQSEKEPLHGRGLTSYDNATKNKVAMIDSVTAEDLYGTAENAVNKGIEIDSQVFKIAGIYQGTASESIFALPESNILIPEEVYYHYFGQNESKNTIVVTIGKNEKPADVTTAVIKALESKGTMRLYGEYQVIDTAMLTEGVSQVMGTITLFVTAVAGISLFIAGVGVMNMMYISVSERTKEIGIRRALGAKKNSIRLQFLLEGMTLTLAGGVIGYAAGILLASIIGSFIDLPVSVDLFTVSLAVGVSSGIGLIFSVMPASAAAKKDLIDILR